MKETGNVFDTSTTLMEIEDLPESDNDSSREDKPTFEAESEPDYFTSPAVAKGGDGRRRAMAVLSVVGGMVFTIVLVNAAVGLGDGSSSPTTPEASPHVEASPTPPRERPPVLQAPPSRPKPSKKEIARAQARQARSERRHAKAATATRSQRHRHPDPPSTASAPPPEPESEPAYTPEPEATYVPEAAPTSPPPASSPPPAAASPQEFGIEP